MRRRRFFAMDCWLRTIESWAAAVDLARQCGVTSDVIETIIRGFPAYPESLMRGRR